MGPGGEAKPCKASRSLVKGAADLYFSLILISMTG